MIVVHHLEKSRSQRVLWLLEELDLPYEVQTYARDPRTLLAPSALRKVHPLGKSPVITDDGRTIAESGSILEYLVGRYGKGRFVPPAGSPERDRYTYWMHYAEGSMMPLLVMKLVLSHIPKASPWPVRPVARAISRATIRGFVDPNLRQHLLYQEAQLAAGPYFAGAEFSAADIQMSFPVQAAVARGGLGPEFPRLSAWLDRVYARPAWKRASEKHGPFELLRTD